MTWLLLWYVIASSPTRSPFRRTRRSPRIRPNSNAAAFAVPVHDRVWFVASQ